MQLLFFGLPVLLGFLLGYFLALPINICITILSVGFAVYALWSTRNDELGALIGLIAAWEIGLFVIALWITIACVTGIHVDMSWLLRAGV